MKKVFVLILIASFIILSFKSSNDYQFVVPVKWPKPFYDFSKNNLSNKKIELGRALFYEPLLSRNNTISCSSCHSQFTAFTHIDHSLSHGIDDRIGKRNSPALMNLAWHNSLMWDGAINHLDMQALAPISNPDEMDEKIEHVVMKLQASKMYPSLFLNAFNDSIITGEHLLKSISQFLVTLVSSNSKYDSVMRQESDFTIQEKNGYKLFKTNCAECHTEPLFTNLKFEINGLPIDTILNDKGRMNVTHIPKDSLKFKVPTLRNIQFSYPYMHDGRFKKLSEVLTHYTEGFQGGVTLSPKLQKKIILSSNERVDLIAFLFTLTDRSFLFNKDYSYPKNIFFPKKKE